MRYWKKIYSMSFPHCSDPLNSGKWVWKIPDFSNEKICCNTDNKIPENTLSVALYESIGGFPVTIHLYVIVCVFSVSSRLRRPVWRLWLPTSSLAYQCCCCLSRCSGYPNLSSMASSSTSPSPPSTETRCATEWLSFWRSRSESVWWK